MQTLDIQAADAALKAGRVIAYPTEGVYGLGCDPFNQHAVMWLLELKQRPVEKGLIVIGASSDQLLPLMAELDPALLDRAETAWPGPVTWLVPAHPDAPPWLTGQYHTIALRVPDHPVCQALCNSFGPLISTSANRTGQPAFMCAKALAEHWGDDLAGVVQGELGGRETPSEIRRLEDNQVIRSG